MNIPRFRLWSLAQLWLVRIANALLAAADRCHVRATAANLAQLNREMRRRS
jgi:hypothetical protein